MDTYFLILNIRVHLRLFAEESNSPFYPSGVRGYMVYSLSQSGKLIVFMSMSL